MQKAELNSCAMYKTWWSCVYISLKYANEKMEKQVLDTEMMDNTPSLKKGIHLESSVSHAVTTALKIYEPLRSYI